MGWGKKGVEIIASIIEQERCFQAANVPVFCALEDRRQIEDRPLAKQSKAASVWPPPRRSHSPCKQPADSVTDVRQGPFKVFKSADLESEDFL